MKTKEVRVSSVSARNSLYSKATLNVMRSADGEDQVKQRSKAAFSDWDTIESEGIAGQDVTAR